MRSQRLQPRQRLAVDVAIALAFVALDTTVTLAGGSWWPARPGALAWALLVVQGLACLSLAAHRRAPLAVAAVFVAFTLAVTLLVSPFGVLHPAEAGGVWAPLGMVLAAYGPVRFATDRRRTALAVPMILLLAVVTTRPWELSASLILLGSLRVAAGPLLALYFVARARLVRALTERAERAEREQHLLAERARAEERARLAAEMHDAVTHRVSLMVLQAGALRVTAPDEPTRKAAEELRAAGCRALDELRDLVGILGAAPDGEQAPATPGLATLAAESTAVGLAIDLVEEGDRRLVSPVVARTVFRIVREALTNARKHAPGARADVRVRYDPAGVTVEIANTAPARPADTALASTGSGLGIASLRRRVELVGGRLDAGPAPGGGFRVEATLPAYVPTASPAHGVA